MIFKALKHRSNIRALLHYIYRGDESKDRHEHKIERIAHIGGNILSNSPVVTDENEFPLVVDIDSMQNEFLEQAEKYKGISDKLYKHYVVRLPDEDQDKLNDYHWMQIANDTMKVMGYDESTKWTAVRHEKNHIHIAACRVKDDGSLLHLHAEAHNVFQVMRDYEIMFDLVRLENPELSLGSEYTKRELVSVGGRANDHDYEFAKLKTKVLKGLSKEQVRSTLRTHNIDVGRIIRARINAIRNEHGGCYPSTMTNFVMALRKRNIDVSISKNADGSPIGISYILMDLPEEHRFPISGSKLKATQLTFNALQKHGVEYKAERDDFALKLAPAPEHISVTLASSSIRVNLKSIKKLKNKHEAELRKISEQESSVFVDFTNAVNADEARAKWLVKMLLEMVKLLFGSKSEEARVVELMARVHMERLAIHQAFKSNELVFDNPVETQYSDPSQDNVDFEVSF